MHNNAEDKEREQKRRFTMELWGPATLRNILSDPKLQWRVEKSIFSDANWNACHGASRHGNAIVFFSRR